MPHPSMPSNQHFSASYRPPKAYQVGHQDFYGHDFLVTPDVLIPRPETEQLIDTVLSLAGVPYLPGVKPSERQLPPHPVIYDIGTGSGCIAITLALALPNATILATDVSKAALQIAQKNAAEHGFYPNDPQLSFIISHLLQNVKSSPDLPPSNTTATPDTASVLPFPDLVVANLPYVDREWEWLDSAALSYEPDLALYAADHGLALIKELITSSAERQIPRLVLEADPCEHTAITRFAKSHGYQLDRINGFILSFVW